MSSAPVIHWSRNSVAECGNVKVRVGEGGTNDLARVTCDACFALSLKSDKPPEGAAKVRQLRQLLKISKRHCGPEQVASVEAQLLAAEREVMAAKKTAENSEVKIEKFTRHLRVALKESEVVERAKRSAFLLGEIQQKESERDAAKKQANAQIEELAAEMHRLSLEVRDGAAYRDVQCNRYFKYRLGLVQEVREDTLEVLHDRPMTEREKQIELDLKVPTGKKDAAAEAKTLSDAVAKAETDAATPPLPTEKKRKPRKPKEQEARA